MSALPSTAPPRARPARRARTAAVTLRAGHGVAFQPDACLNAFRAEYGCDICATACPVEAIRPEGFGIALAETCLDCGQCATACPTGALSLPEPAGTLFECARVPEGDRLPGATTVVCLGGVSAERLAEIGSVGDGAVLVDRDLCAGCRLGAGRAAPWADAVDAACTLVAAAGRPATTAPQVITVPAPQRPVPLRGEEVDTARRGLLRRFAPPSEAAPTATFERVGPVATPKLARRAAAVAALAETDPPGFLPALIVSDACRLHGICAASCPTGALAFGVSETEAVLAFDAARCIGCGDCAAVCPEKALSVDSGAAARPSPEPQVLRRQTSKLCPKCEAAFTPSPGEALCPACMKSDALMREISSLFP